MLWQYWFLSTFNQGLLCQWLAPMLQMLSDRKVNCLGFMGKQPFPVVNLISWCSSWYPCVIPRNQHGLLAATRHPPMTSISMAYEVRPRCRWGHRLPQVPGRFTSYQPCVPSTLARDEGSLDNINYEYVLPIIPERGLAAKKSLNPVTWSSLPCTIAAEAVEPFTTVSLLQCNKSPHWSIMWLHIGTS